MFVPLVPVPVVVREAVVEPAAGMAMLGAMEVEGLKLPKFGPDMVLPLMLFEETPPPPVNLINPSAPAVDPVCFRVPLDTVRSPVISKVFEPVALFALRSNVPPLTVTFPATASFTLAVWLVVTPKFRVPPMHITLPPTTTSGVPEPLQIEHVPASTSKSPSMYTTGLVVAQNLSEPVLVVVTLHLPLISIKLPAQLTLPVWLAQFHSKLEKL